MIERGYLAYDLWDDEMFPGITNRGSAYIQEKYVVESGTFEITYPTEAGVACIVLEGLELFVFDELRRI